MNRNEKATWEKLQNPFGESKTRPMEEVVDSIQRYVATYHQQYGYQNYSDNVFIDDILYGLGRALDIQYENADGFDRFKREVLLPHLGIHSEHNNTEE